MSTYDLARRGGAGTELGDGVRRFRVSDWSDGTREVFGHVMRDGEWCDYQRLPQTLSIWRDVIGCYEESDLRAPDGSPADVAMRAALASGEPAEFGESTDPVVRAHRRLKGIDGLRSDIHDMARPFHDAMDAIREEARHVAADMVRVRISELEDVLTRHRITASSYGLVAYSLDVEPPLRGFGPHPRTDLDSIVDAGGWLHRDDVPFKDLGAWIHEISKSISAIMISFADDFSMDIGKVTSDREHDLETCYGMVMTAASPEETAEAEE